MINALGTAQKLLIVGGTSDIGLAVAQRLLAERPQLQVVLAARPSPRRDAAAADMTMRGASVQTLDFDALDLASHQQTVDAAAAGGYIDIAVIAFGQLGDQDDLMAAPGAAAELAQVNFVAPVSVGTILTNTMRRQGHGVIVALSSVAGERPRKSNFVYGSTKAGMDAFFTGLGDSLVGTGVRVLVVRPGFVHTKMTAGLKAAPLSTRPAVVANAIVAALRSGKETLWVPGTLRPVMMALRHTPRAVFRKLPI